jgi:hypothetical protein
MRFGLGDLILEVQRAMSDDAIAMAARYVAETRCFVEWHRQQLVRLRTKGACTRDAERNLIVFEKTLALFEEHERVLRKFARLLH